MAPLDGGVKMQFDRWLENSSASSGQEAGREIAAMYR